jgi:hypothetical protein
MIMPLNELLYGVSVIDALADQLVSFDIATVAEAIGLGIGSVTAPISTLLRRGRGRPRKFAVPSRAVTLTLPENVLDALAKIDPDPSRAIVELAGRRVHGNANGSGKSPAELATFGRRAVISIRPTPTLQRRAGIELVPMPDGRALISFEQPTTIAELELTIYDALEDKNLSPEDRRVFEAIGSILKEARRSDDVTLLRRSIIVLESTMSRRSPKSVLSKSSR